MAMPQFKVAKTDDIDKLNNKEFVEDKLYILETLMNEFLHINKEDLG